jgi:hypothetical protein
MAAKPKAVEQSGGVAEQTRKLMAQWFGNTVDEELSPL